MATAAQIWVFNVVHWINWVLFIFALVIEGAAFIHCLMQRSDAFQAIGTLPKPAWLAILGFTMVLGLPSLFGTLSIFGLIGIAAAALYLLDVRIGLRDVTGGTGW